MSRRELILTLIATILVIITGFNYYYGKIKTVSTTMVFRGDLETIIKESGLVDSESSEKIISNVEGTIANLSLKEGDSVKVGQVLCVIRNPSLREKIRQLEAELSLIEQETKKRKDSQSLGRYNFLKENIADLKSFVAPVSHIEGKVILLNVKNGEKVFPGKLLMIIADMENPILKLRLKESDIPNVKVGQIAIITGDFLGNKVLPGKVSKISPMVTRELSPFVETWVKIYNPQKLNIKYGAYAEATIITGKKQNVLMIPKETLISDHENYVFVVENNKRIKKRQVEIGVIGNEFIEITSGLNERELVVINPLPELKEGERVKVKF